MRDYALRSLLIFSCIIAAIVYIGTLTHLYDVSTIAIVIVTFLFVLHTLAPSFAIFNAINAYKRGDNEAALQICHKLMVDHPRYHFPLITASAVYLAQAQAQKAKELCDRAIELAPKSYKCWINRSIAQGSLGQAEAAFSDANRAVELAPKASAAWSQRSYLHVQLWNLDSAVSDATQAICLGKANYSAFLYRGFAELVRCRYDRARADAQAVASLGCIAESLFLQAQINVKTNHLDQALQEFDQIIELAKTPSRLSDTAKVLGMRARAYASRGEVERAIEDCTRALEIDPNQFLALENRTYAYCIAKNFDKAMFDISALAAMPLLPYQKAYMYRQRARFNLAQGKIIEALDDANQSLALSYEYAPLRTTRGVILTRLNRHEEALTDLNKALEFDHYDAEAYWFRHELFDAMGDYQSAKEDKKIAEDYDYKPYL
jgi:tetratricopeptide (TPR) repeat protein